MSIQLLNISKFYLEAGKKQTILSGLNAHFPKGKFSVVLGRSGSGKSTLLNIIGGIDTPNSGDVLVENINLSNLSDYERTLFRRRQIGFIFQFFNLIPTLTVLENTLLISELDGIDRHKAKMKAIGILERVGMGSRIDSMPDNLSGGEQQRVAIARALANNPQIILADEPTGNLDHNTGSIVLDMMVQLIREETKTLVMATHSKEALAIADHIFQIENGLLIHISPDDIRKKQY